MEVKSVENSIKPPTGGLLNFFQKKTINSRQLDNGNSTSNLVKNNGDKKLKDKVELDCSDDPKEIDTDKENRKGNRLVVKMKSSFKKKRKKEESSDEEDFEELMCKKKVKQTEPDPSPSTDLGLEHIVSVPKADVTIDIIETSQDSDQEKVETPSVKPKKPISSFFTKVTKEERLQKCEQDNSQLEVKVLVHHSPEASEESPTLPLANVTRKSVSKSSRRSRKSNVSRSAAETEKIEVVDVEVSENVEVVDMKQKNEVEEEVVEMELDTAANADEAARKISNKLFGTKTKRRSKGESEPKNCEEEDSDTSVNMESLENTPVKKASSTSNSPVKKVPKLNNCPPPKSAFSLLMNKKKQEPEVVTTEPVEDTSQDVLVHSKPKKVSNNAFATLMKNSRKSFEPPPPEESEADVSVIDVENPVKESQPKPKQSPNSAKNAFIKLMKSGNSSIEPEDVKLKNMLNVLNSVDSEDDVDAEIMEIFTKSKKDKKKKKKKVKVKTRQIEKDQDASVIIDQNSDESDDCEEESVFDIRCKTTMGKFHLRKFESGGQGKCIQHQDDWFTPNEFERFSGSKAKKYKVSLFVEDKPIVKFLEARNIQTPSRNSSRASGRSTPGSELGADRRTPVESPCVTPVSTRKKGRKKRILQDEPPLKETKTSEESIPVLVVPESPEDSPAILDQSIGRRSGRIARNAANIAEKRKQAEEQELALEEAERKVEAERKARNAAVKKQRKLMEKLSQSQESSSSGSDFSDDEVSVEKIVVKSGKQPTGKLASIFTKGKKEIKPAEDPAVVAARKAFLMSSAPDTLRSQISGDYEETILETGHQVWPGPNTCPSHVSDVTTRVASSPGSWQYKELDTEIVIPRIEAGLLRSSSDDVEDDDKRCQAKLSEADVMATMEVKSGLEKKMFNSLMERRMEAEMFEKEARDKNLSLADLEEKRIRGNRRRSRRSMELKEKGSEAGKYCVDSGSGLMWSSKYQPRSGADILGNEDTVSGLREWLRTWSGATNKSGSGSTSEDMSSDCESDSVDTSLVDSLGNTALIEGPPGSGKTAAVFALAAQMGFNVLEVNASSNRTGKQILSMLSEATQSQQVRRDSDSKVPASIFGKGSKKVEDKSDTKKMKTALILFEDIDLVIDDLDEGFYSAVNSLASSSKRPMILTTSSPSWLGDGVGSAGEKVLKFSPRQFQMRKVGDQELCQHLQMIALIEGYHVAKTDVKKIVSGSRDVRQSMLQLQLLCNSGVIPGDITDNVDHDDDATKVDIKKWFRHLDAKSRRSGVSAPVSGLGVADLPRDWWSSLPGDHLSPPDRGVKYPLSLEDVPKASYSRIDPLRNKDLFDDEDSTNDTTMEEDISSEPGVQTAAKPVLSKEQRQANYTTLSMLSSHLDNVATWDLDQDRHGWHSLQPVSDSTSQHLQTYRSAQDDVNDVEKMYRDVVMSHSREFVNKHVDDDAEWVKLRDVDVEEVLTAQQSLFYSGLTDIFLTDRRGRLDLLSGMRNIARGEEVRKLQVSHDSRRGNRFFHYFTQCEAVLEEQLLINLCNSLVD